MPENSRPGSRVMRAISASVASEAVERPGGPVAGPEAGLRCGLLVGDAPLDAVPALGGEDACAASSGVHSGVEAVKTENFTAACSFACAAPVVTVTSSSAPESTSSNATGRPSVADRYIGAHDGERRRSASSTRTPGARPLGDRGDDVVVLAQMPDDELVGSAVAAAQLAGRHQLGGAVHDARAARIERVPGRRRRSTRAGRRR